MALKVYRNHKAYCRGGGVGGGMEMGEEGYCLPIAIASVADVCSPVIEDFYHHPKS